MFFGIPAFAPVAEPRQRTVPAMPAKTLLLTLLAAASLLLAVATAHSAGLGRPGAQQGQVLRLPGATIMAALADQARSATPAAPVADSATEQIVQLQGQLLQLLTDAKRQQAQLTELRHRLAAAEAVNDWLPWLVLGLVAAAAGAVWLGLRVRRLQRDQAHPGWASADAHPHTARATAGGALAAAPLMAPDQHLLSGGALAQPLGPAQAPLPPPAPSRVPTMAPPQPGGGLRPADSFAMGTGVPPRPVSVEELLDLDQQVDFFRVLGQQQAAIDLLLSHVRATGGTSALPYFKLLEIYRQQDDEEAYERTRERFNLRFNGVAPDWQGDLAAGRCLADYPDVVGRLQKFWSQPSLAVAELEALLLRRADLEPFDLPAFHDLLTLHALVRDLPAPPAHGLAPAAPMPAPTPTPTPTHTPLPLRDADAGQVTVAVPRPARPAPALALAQAGADAVDLLLPLGDGPLDITLPRPRLSEPGAARAMLADWVFSRAASRSPDAATDALPTLAPDSPPRPAKLDLDLSDFAPAPREFTRPAAFTDVDRRRDNLVSDLAAFDDSDLLPPSISRR